MDLRSRKKMAADVMGIGVSRVKISQDAQEDVSKAITRDDIRQQIEAGTISAKPKRGISRGRLRAKLKQKEKGRRRGQGRRTGSRKARRPGKDAWISKIRAIRDELRKMKEAKEITPTEYRRYYRQAKGNLFNSRRHLRELVGRMVKK
jgi:large subunit ribosomal protein L19e